ncbi:LysR substrate-binding domain-containing protein [Mariniluteicoccus flavus]
MLNPIHLRTLVTVVRTGSFADAARRLGYTGSAVSQQIASLERAVRLTLFEREAHSVRPTPAAEFLAEHAHEVLAVIAQLEDEVSGLAEGQRGLLRVGSFATASERIIPRWLAAHRRDHPDLEVHLDEGEPDQLLPLIADGELDLALVYRYDLVPRPWPRGIQRLPLLEDPLVLLLPESHPLADHHEVALGRLAEEVWINTTEPTSCAMCLQRLCAKEGFEPQIAYRSDNYAVIRGLVQAGLGIALVPTLGHLETPGVKAVRLAGVDVRRHIFLTHRGPAGPHVAQAIAALQAAAADCDTDAP